MVLRKCRALEEFGYASMNTTIKASERYYIMAGDNLIDIYQDTRASKGLAKGLGAVN
jgi:hypothetical protein